jgi:hypothetical protein
VSQELDSNGARADAAHRQALGLRPVPGSAGHGLAASILHAFGPLPGLRAALAHPMRERGGQACSYL